MSFKITDGDGPGKEERDRERRREWAKDEFSGTIRELAANMFRVVRGAGKGYELLVQMKTVIDSAIKYRDSHDYWPSSDVIGSALRRENEMETVLERGRAGTLAQEHIDRWWKAGKRVTFHAAIGCRTVRRCRNLVKVSVNGTCSLVVPLPIK
jgi:hypothetical protein